MKNGTNDTETEYWLVLGRCMRQWRERAELSQNELAKRAGISRAELQFIERGMRRAKIDTLKYCCKALKLSLVMLLAEVDFCQAEQASSSQG